MLKKSIGQEKEGNEAMDRTIKISDVVFEMLGDIGKIPRHIHRRSSELLERRTMR